MISASRSYDVVILGSGIAGLAGALAAHALGLQPVVLATPILAEMTVWLVGIGGKTVKNRCVRARERARRPSANFGCCEQIS